MPNNTERMTVKLPTFVLIAEEVGRPLTSAPEKDPGAEVLAELDLDSSSIAPVLGMETVATAIVSTEDTLLEAELDAADTASVGPEVP